MAKDSRLAEIYRQELKDKGLLSALVSASSERRKEKMDVRNLLPSTGLTGAAFQKVFGRAYKYGSKKDSVRDIGGGMESKSFDNKLTRMSIDTKITAKNSIVLPGMARDMNVMRQNMQQMVRLNGGKPAKGADALFKRSGQRTSIYKSLTGTKETNKPEEKESGSMIGGLMSTLGGVGSGILGGLGAIGGGLLSLGGSILGGIGSLIGGVAGGIFNIISGALSALGPLGIILGAAAGFMIYQIAKSIDFEKMGSDFKKIYVDISKSIKEFFGVGDDNNEKSMVRIFAEKLDQTFKTTMFSDTLNSMNDIIQKSFDKISDVTIGAFNFVSGALIALAQDMKGHFLQFIDEYGTYLIAAAAGGGALAAGAGGAAVSALGRGGLTVARLAVANPVAAALAATAGAAYYGLSKLAPNEQERLEKGIPDERKRIEATLKGDSFMALGSGMEKKLKDRLAELKEEEKSLIAKAAQKEKEKEMRRTDHFSNFVNSNTLSNSIQSAGTERQRISESNDEKRREASRYSPSRDNSSSLMADSGSISGKTFGSLTEDQKQAFLDAQTKAEGGVTQSGVIREYNNPGAMTWAPGSIAAKWGAVEGEKGFTGADGKRYSFAKFPTMQAGQAAQRALWESSGYRDKPLSEALRKWNGTKEGTLESSNYEKLIANAIGTTPSITAGTPSSGNAVTPSSNPMESIMASMAAATQQLSQIELNKQMQQAAASPVFRGGQMPGAPQMKATPYHEEFYRNIVGTQSLL
jgi:Skp family chaperone for outer membrane proteins